MKAAEEPRTLGRRGYAWPGLPPPCLAFMAVKDLCSDRYTEAWSSTPHISKISRASVTLTDPVSCSSNMTDFQPREAHPFFFVSCLLMFQIEIHFMRIQWAVQLAG